MIPPQLRQKLEQLDSHLQNMGMGKLTPQEMRAVIDRGGSGAPGPGMPPGAPGTPQQGVPGGMAPPGMAPGGMPQGGPPGAPQGGQPGMPGMPGMPGQPPNQANTIAAGGMAPGQFTTKIQIDLGPMGQVTKFSKTLSAANQGGNP